MTEEKYSYLLTLSLSSSITNELSWSVPPLTRGIYTSYRTLYHISQHWHRSPDYHWYIGSFQEIAFIDILVSFSSWIPIHIRNVNFTISIHVKFWFNHVRPMNYRDRFLLLQGEYILVTVHCIILVNIDKKSWVNLNFHSITMMLCVISNNVFYSILSCKYAELLQPFTGLLCIRVGVMIDFLCFYGVSVRFSLCFYNAPNKFWSCFDCVVFFAFHYNRYFLRLK
jgi:hypothetical protein